MKTVRFIGKMAMPNKTSRVLLKPDMDRLGIKSPLAELRFSPENNHQIEMSNEASESLLAALPNEFELVPESDDADEPDSSDDDDPEDDPDSSEGDKTADDDDSSDDD